MGSYYKRQKQVAVARQMTRAPWLYHTTLPDLLPSIREQGLRPLRDVASRLARDAAEKAAADAGSEVDPAFVHLHAAEELLRLVLLMEEVALLRVRTASLDPALLTRDPRRVLELIRSEDPARGPAQQETIARLQMPKDAVLEIGRRLQAPDVDAALERVAPFVAAVTERQWEAAPIHGWYRYAGIVPAASLEVLLELPPVLRTIASAWDAMATPLHLDSRPWASLPAADLGDVARGLGRTEFLADSL
jgi:predicted RecB family endonuclease